MAFVIGGLISIFLFRAIVMFIGSKKERMGSDITLSMDFRPFVSVIIPSRNEESNIELCVRSIMASTYDSARFEVIAVNDRSSDKTVFVLNKLAEEFSNLIVVTISDETEERNLRGKPGALQAGIEASKGEIILMTDADCTVSNKWIETLVAQYQDPDVGLVASYTLVSGERIFDKVQEVEWIYMCAMGSAGVGINQPLGCFGNNLSIRRTDYIKTGGYENIKFSVTEDLALLKAVHSMKRKIKYICHKDAAINTLPVKNFSEYISQHRRWAIGGYDLGWRAAIFVVASVAIWSGILISLYFGNFQSAFAVVVARILGDYSIIWPSADKIKKGNIRAWIIPSIVFFMLIEILIPVLAINTNIKWKGQTFKRH